MPERVRWVLLQGWMYLPFFLLMIYKCPYSYINWELNYYRFQMYMGSTFS